MSVFRFKHFDIQQSRSSMKVGTDAMILGSLIDVEGHTNALDVGTGTGVLSLMITQRNPIINCVGIDLDKESIEEARTNFSESIWSDRLSVVSGDFLKANFEQNFNLIISNPPYYTSTLENDNARKAQARHVSSLPIDQFVSKATELLTREGKFWIIIPFDDIEKWKREASKNRMSVDRMIEISGKENQHPNRCVLCFSKLKSETKIESLAIRNQVGEYSKAYRELTKEYHGKPI